MSLSVPKSLDTHPYGHEEAAAYIVRLPVMTPSAPLIVSCPHAGIWLPDDVDASLAVDSIKILNRGDRYTDWLTMGAPDLGASQIICTTAPAWLNVGRSTLSLWPEHVREGIGNLEWDPDDIYAKHGQGLIATRTLYGNEKIYKHGYAPEGAEIAERIADLYNPYHDRLQKLVKDTVKAHGKALVFDAHSAPSFGAPKDPDSGRERADIIISNLRDRSCDPALVSKLQKIAENFNFTVSVNDPYLGGFITKKYSRDGEWGQQNVQSIQIEFKRAAIGINEQTLVLEDPAKFQRLQACAQKMMAEMANHIA